jgi:hypothetical protein
VPQNELIVKVVTNYKETTGFEIINFQFITNQGTMNQIGKEVDFMSPSRSRTWNFDPNLKRDFVGLYAAVGSEGTILGLGPITDTCGTTNLHIIDDIDERWRPPTTDHDSVM